MLGLIYRLIVGRFNSCQHEWEVKQTYTLTYEWRGNQLVYVMQCKKCGDLKNHKITD
jgi:hypothetical protein